MIESGSNMLIPPYQNKEINLGTDFRGDLTLKFTNYYFNIPNFVKNQQLHPSTGTMPINVIETQ